jgi:hypothetical protein
MKNKRMDVMQQTTQFRTTISPSGNSIGRSPLRLGFFLIPFAIAVAGLALSPQARAVCQEGCLTHGNTVLGEDALLNDTSPFGGNTAIGFEALYSNTLGNLNTAIGADALVLNTEGGGNTATGVGALFSNTLGNLNTAIGANALYNNTDGRYNTANGHNALAGNTIGNFNTAIGIGALYSNTIGNLNTANGNSALSNNTSGSNNIALGDYAGLNLTTGDGNIDIGNGGVAAESNTIRIGTQGTQTKTFIAGINGAGVMGAAVKVNAAGQLGTAPSSQRFKEKIRPMDKGSEAILALKPVTFRYKKEIDPDRIRQFGLVAEEVEKVNPVLVTRDADGKPYTVRYDAVNAMLLNEFLKEHKKVQELEATVATLAATVKEQAAQIQKVSAQVEMSRPAPQTVADNR